MSWLFGLKKGANPDISETVENISSGGVDAKGHVPVGHQFDSAALERAAKAAKELEKSPNAKEILKLTIKQEETKQAENLKLMKEHEMQVEGYKMEQIRLAGEESRKKLSEEYSQKQRQADYQDQLARRRYDEQLEQQTKAQAESLRLQEESVARQEAMRLKATEQELKMRQEVEVKKVEAKVRAQAISDRENRELNLEKIRAEAEEKRKTTIGSLQSVGVALEAFLGDKKKLTTSVAALTALAAGIYISKHGVGIAARFIENRISKPSLVRETSRLTVTDAFTHPIKMFRRLTSKPKDVLKGIVLQPKLEEKLRDLAIATHHTKLNKGYYRNILFYGPPGTGKTMFAKSLASHSGMDYAIMTGGDVTPLGREGVTAMHRVFDWAKTSRKGLLLFVDEADAFLQKRSGGKISEDVRSTLNAFLYQTGEQSDKFMLVLASNLPEDFDIAINDRIDEVVEFGVPTLEERERMVRLYFEKFVLKPASEGKRRLKVDEFDYSAKCSEIARKTEGFSGREISKMGLSWQAATYSSWEGVLTEAMIDRSVSEALITHQKKLFWEPEGRNDNDEKRHKSDKKCSSSIN